MVISSNCGTSPAKRSTSSRTRQISSSGPAAAGRNLARSARQHAVWSVVLALFSGLVGLTLSYYLDTSAGASIVLVSALCYAVSLAIRSSRK